MTPCLAEKRESRRTGTRIWVRAVAGLIDAMALVVVCTAGMALSGPAIERFDCRPLQPGRIGDFAFIGLALAMTLCEVAFDASPGKLLMGLRIRAADGHRAPRQLLLRRWALKFSPLIVAALAGLLATIDDALGKTWQPWIDRLALAAQGAALVVALGALGITRRPHVALYDLIAGTTVLGDHPDRRTSVGGFEPLMSSTPPGRSLR